MGDANAAAPASSTTAHPAPEPTGCGRLVRRSAGVGIGGAMGPFGARERVSAILLSPSIDQVQTSPQR
jgi:hypothetical protein